MKNTQERRLYYRKDYGKPVTIYLLYKPEKYFFGTVGNYSSGGMKIFTTGRINVETPVVIRMHEYNSDAKGPEKNDEYYGVIRWSNTLDESDLPYRYEYGMKYDMPVEF